MRIRSSNRAKKKILVELRDSSFLTSHQTRRINYSCPNFVELTGRAYSGFCCSDGLGVLCYFRFCHRDLVISTEYGVQILQYNGVLYEGNRYYS